MIVLAYLLVIAVTVALWAAVSLRRVGVPRSDHTDRSSTADAPRAKRREGPASHDAYRGVRAQQRSAEVSFTDPYRVDEPAGPETTAGVASKAAVRPRSAEASGVAAAGTEVRTDGIRVVESRRERERKAEKQVAERTSKDDAFERFLRANEDFER